MPASGPLRPSSSRRLLLSAAYRLPQPLRWTGERLRCTGEGTEPAVRSPSQSSKRASEWRSKRPCNRWQNRRSRPVPAPLGTSLGPALPEPGQPVGERAHELAEALVGVQGNAEAPGFLQRGEAVGDAPQAPRGVDGLLLTADTAGGEHGQYRPQRFPIGRPKLGVVGVGEPVGAHGGLVEPRPLLDEGPVSLREREERFVARLSHGGTG